MISKFILLFNCVPLVRLFTHFKYLLLNNWVILSLLQYHNLKHYCVETLYYLIVYNMSYLFLNIELLLINMMINIINFACFTLSIFATILIAALVLTLFLLYNNSHVPRQTYLQTIMLRFQLSALN